MSFRALVPTGIAASHLDDPRWVVVDCRFELSDPTAGQRFYREAHIPGAVYADLDRHLSTPPTRGSGRHPLPHAAGLQATFSQWGIDRDVQVVAYDAGAGMFASRLWWLLRYLGHDDVAVLDGGLTRWVGEARPTRAGEETRAPARFSGAPRDSMCVSVDEVERRYRDPAYRLVDARAPERYRGEVEPLDPVAGHIPGAVNHFFQANLAPDGTFLSPEALRARLEPILEGRDPSRVISYCGSGVTACHTLLALEHADLPGARLYAGSWSQWCADPKRPTEAP